jgi:hypothetical protein
MEKRPCPNLVLRLSEVPVGNTKCQMSHGVYWTLGAVLFAFGIIIGKWRLAPVVPLVLWAVGGGIAALAGLFEATGEDTSLGLVVFFIVDTTVWVVCAVLGVVVRRAVHWQRHRQTAAPYGVSASHSRSRWEKVRSELSGR